MTELEKTLNPMNDVDKWGSEIIPENEPSFDLSSTEEKKSDSSQETYFKNTENNQILNEWNSNPQEELEPSPTNETNDSTNSQTNEDYTPAVEEAPSSNEVILWNFEDTTNNTINEDKDSLTTAFPILEQPTILENSQTIWESNILDTENEQKEKISQKTKLAQIIKIHESKAQKKWFIAGISSGIIITAWVLILAWIFAKDQIISVLNTTSGEPTLSASIIDLWEKDEENYPDIIVDEDDSENVEDISDTEEFNSDIDENIDENTDSEFIEDISDEYSEESDNYEFIENLEYNENLDEYTDSEYVEDISDEYSEESDNYEFIDENINMWYAITHVDSEVEANWVIPAHCSDLTCYGEDKDFTPCTKFKMVETLDENANRIWSNWVCRYKDSSELVYVELY